MTREANLNVESGNDALKFDDDGRVRRTGTMWTASAHIITAVIGSGVLSLSWALAQLGWIVGPVAILAFAVITWFTSILLADCYRSADGTRNYTYKDVVEAHLGGFKVQLCVVAQYSALIGFTIGYAITASISMVAMKRAHCFHVHGHEAGCHMSNNPYIMSFGVIQIILCQIPNFHKLSGLSFLAAVMSFAYASIGLGLSITKFVDEGGNVEKSLTGIAVGKISSTEKMWRSFSSLGNIAFAYAFSTVLIEIQDTIRSEIPENKVMKRATLIGISVSTVFYMLCGTLGYAAFGDEAPGNFLTSFGFYEPYWLVAFANLCIVIHLIGAYQVFAQPIFGFIETRCNKKWGENSFITGQVNCGCFDLSLFRLVWRTVYVILTTALAMLFPFFNDFVGLIGAIAFWPLTVYFPIEMYIARAKVPTCSLTWIGLQMICLICLVVSLLAAAGSVEGLVNSLRTFKPFNSVS